MVIGGPGFLMEEDVNGWLVRWPCCGTAVFALAGWRLLTRCHTRPQGLSRAHAAMAPRLHAAMLPSGRQQEDKKRKPAEKKRARRGKDKVQKEGWRRTRSGDQLAAGQAAHKKDKKRTTGRHRPDTAFTGAARDCGQLIFLRENPNS